MFPTRSRLIKYECVVYLDKPSYLFDAGKKPRVATNGKVAVVVNEFANRIFLGTVLDEDLPDKALLGTASLVFDRANWINDHRGKLRDKTLRNLVLPASHDAAQYLESIALQSQTLNIFGQLSAGVRWFDLRLVLSLGTIKIHHAGFAGVDFQDVLKDIRTFMKEHTELVILKISHFLNFNAEVYATAISMIRDAKDGLRPWITPTTMATLTTTSRSIPVCRETRASADTATGTHRIRKTGI
jgi:hypothetical protein